MNASNNEPTASAGTAGRWVVSTPQARPDERRQIALEWIASALAGVREMHQNEVVRQAVARRLF
jgi:hypothetical protein